GFWGTSCTTVMGLQPRRDVADAEFIGRRAGGSDSVCRRVGLAQQLFLVPPQGAVVDEFPPQASVHGQESPHRDSGAGDVYCPVLIRSSQDFSVRFSGALVPKI